MDENKSSPGFQLHLVLWSAAGLAMAMAMMYVLSVGPACWLMFHGYLSDELYAAAYFPLVKAAETFSLLGDFVVFWTDWWVPMGEVIESVKVSA